MEDSNYIRTIIADSQFLIVEGLKALLKAEKRFCIQSIVSAKTELFKALESQFPNLLIADLDMISDFEIPDLKKLKNHPSELQILVLTNPLSRSEVNRIVDSGIRNIIYKSTGKEELLTAIEFTLKGKKYYCEEILDLLLEPSAENKSISEKPGTLTHSEIEVVKLIASGLTAKEIAFKKNLSIHTINTHRKNIFRKTDVSNVSELIMVAIKAGWIDNIEYYI